MSKKIRTRKQHNAHKRAQRVFNNVRLWSWESAREDGLQVAHGMARIGHVWRDLTQQQVAGIIDHPNNWIIICRALCLAGDTEWVETEARAARHVRVNIFEDIYADMRNQVFESVQRRHVIDCGWIIQSFSDVARIDDEKLPLFELGASSEARREKWHTSDIEKRQELCA